MLDTDNSRVGQWLRISKSTKHRMAVATNRNVVRAQQPTLLLSTTFQSRQTSCLNVSLSHWDRFVHNATTPCTERETLFSFSKNCFGYKRVNMDRHSVLGRCKHVERPEATESVGSLWTSPSLVPPFLSEWPVAVTAPMVLRVVYQFDG